jgi:3-deoxy-D-manno-octulosonate 8-phosphate phosphatase (KDO 8-P phosphatase)
VKIKTMPDLKEIKLLCLDVDGTLTDGRIFYSDTGQEMRSFDVHDGLGMVLARHANLPIAWITGRQSSLVEKRAKELKISYLYQKVHDKKTQIEKIAQELEITMEQVAFMGDDLNDLISMQACGIAIAPKNAVPDVQKSAHIVTEREGGRGAVREVIDAILRAQGTYEEAVKQYNGGQ